MRQDLVWRLVEHDLAVRQGDLDRFDPVPEPPPALLEEITGLALAAGAELHRNLAIGGGLCQPHLASVVRLTLAEPDTCEIRGMLRHGNLRRHQYERESGLEHQPINSQDGIWKPSATRWGV